MKYLKIFENFEKDGYEIISREEHDRMVYQRDTDEVIYKWEEFSEEEIKEISSFFKYGFKFITGERGSYMASTRGWQYNVEVGELVSVLKLPDEWYLVSVKSTIGHTYDSITNYKCDQYDSLIKLLKKNII